MKKEFLILILFSAIFWSCEYEFDSDNFINIEQPTVLSDYIEIVNFNSQDTINVERVMVYNFLGDEDQNTIESKVYLNNEQINSSWDGQSGSFVLTPQNYDDGIYQLRIEHTFTSGSGSIADQSLLEIRKEIANYKFVVKRFPSPPSILSAEIIDGTIYVDWATDYETDFTNSYLKLNFKTQEIKIPLTNEELALGSYNDTSTVLYEGNENSLEFDRYSKVTYSILLENEFEELSGLSKSIIYEPDSIETEIVFVDFNTFKFKWTAHPLYANFEEFYFSFIGGEFTGSSLGGEYLVSSPPTIGEEYTLNMRPNGTGFSIPNYAHRNLSFEGDSAGDLDLDPLFIREIVYDQNTDRFFALVIEDRIGSSVYKFSIYEYAGDMQFIQKSNQITYDNPRYEYLDITLSPNGSIIYIDARSKAYKMDASSLQILNVVNGPQTGSEIMYRGDILASLDYSSNVLTVTNLASNTILYSGAPTPLSAGVSYISSDAQYITITDNTGYYLYKIVGNQLTQVYDFSSDFTTGNIVVYEDKLLYAIINQVVFVDLLNNTTNTFNFGTSQQSLQYDRFSEQLLVSQNGLNVIYDINSEGSFTFQSENNKQTTGLFNQQDRDYLLRLWNNKLIHTKGILIDLN